MLRGAPCDGPRKIRFTDETIETRSIVELFVNLAVDRQAAFNLTSLENNLWPKKVDRSILHGIDKIMTLLAFLWKWDCGPVLETLASELELLMKCGTLSPRDVFCLGAILDDPELCTASLAFSQTTRIWPPFDIGCVPPKVWKLARPEYLYALCQTRLPMRRMLYDDTFRHFLAEAKAKMSAPGGL